MKAGRTSRGRSNPVRHAAVYFPERPRKSAEAVCGAALRPWPLRSPEGTAVEFDPKHPRSCARCVEVLAILQERRP